MDVEELVNRNREAILNVCSRHGARNVRLFGSASRGEGREGSDVDLLVDFDPDRSLLDHVALVLDLQELLGCRVDVVAEAGLYWLVRRRVLKEARPL